ncbi:MAG: CAP domain-containing protein [Tabrizicola sp.]|uniref:CAP domain-containing protein n=1 Tax=Tabrizicola sp. TaxID=2005166 RepID=UPI002732EE5B|nr:CAP domain-containing protein [Tabrizicola sp.]MDP3264628.1 CAP domain-containing protein [Tabrizicola sp.]MDP3647692.1 CAP domain-containing protein [Paracoccaceae bacterium]
MSFRLSFAAAIAAAVVSVTAAQAACNIPANSGAMQAELIDHLNAERAARGLKPLRLSPSLDKAAQGHACDNAKRQSISHVSSDGSQLQNRLRRAGYAYRTAAENTGRGFATGKRAVEWWMNSPHHKHNMLIGQMRDVGVGIAMSAAPDSRLHWIIVMGKSK